MAAATNTVSVDNQLRGNSAVIQVGDISIGSISAISITNFGVFYVSMGTPIINQPNVGIISVGSFQKRPVVKETEYGDTIVVRHMVYLTLSYDHRIIDGAYGTKFLARLVEIIEQYNNDKIK